MRVKTPKQIQEQSKMLLNTLWQYDCRVPGNVQRRNVRISLVNILTSRRLHPDCFKVREVTFAECLQDARNMNN